MGRISAGIVTLTFKIGTKILTVIAKLAKVGKIGLAIGSTVSYAYLFTWQFSLMIIILLFVHESGHIWAMKRCGMKTKGIYFIPFLGAAAVTDEMFKTRRDEAYIAIMGPIWGFALSGIVGIIYVTTGNALFAAAAGWMAMVNLFNLLPVSPLDGGRIIKSITFSINSKFGFTFLLFGIIVSIILTFWVGIILFFLLLIIACLEFIFEYKMKNVDQVIKRCIKYLDNIISNKPPGDIGRAANDIKRMLLNEKEDQLVRIKKIISLGTEINNAKIDNIKTEYDYDTRILSRILLDRLEMCDSIPKMTVRGIVITSMAYIGIVAILWALMVYMSNIPEVEIARKFFMSIVG